MYNLKGGILAWNNAVVADLPRLKVFDAESADATLADLLYVGMNLERGAWRYYSAVLERYKDSSFARPIDLLARAEEGHARLLYTFWAEEKENPPLFDELYSGLAGDIIEGGREVESLISQLATLSDNPCLEIVEMALGIEFTAFDLYRSMAHRYSNSPFEEPFLAIAEAEKEHMRIAADALEFCG